MIKAIESCGKTQIEAVEEGLSLLRADFPDITEQDVEIELLEKPKSGFFGFGSVDAKVRLSYQLNQEQKAVEFLRGVLKRMGVEAELTPTIDEEGTIAIEISGENMGVVIGRRGDTLDALQFITSIVVNKDELKHVRVSLDTENYRKKRCDSLENLAKRVAARVVKYKKNVTLEPMSSYERRVIHSALQGYKGITTFSTGSEPNRKVVVAVAGYVRGKGKSVKPKTDDETFEVPEADEE